MGIVDIPLINPIRFRSGTDTNIYPVIDRMKNRYNHQRGIISNVNYIPDWKVGQQIIIQVYTTLSGTSLSQFNMQIITPLGVQYMTRTEITYSGWLGNNYIYTFSYTPSIVGEYYMKMPNYGYISDSFYVHATDGDLIEIKYYDSRNRYGGAFYNTSGNLIWQPRTYLTGTYEVGDFKNNYSYYEDDPGIFYKLNSEPQRMIDVTFNDITKLLIDQLNIIFSCDHIFINNMPVQNTDIPGKTGLEKSDMCDISIKFMRTDNDFMVKKY